MVKAMGVATDIQWVTRCLPTGSIIQGHTFNPWWGCLKVSEGCGGCYAKGIAVHYGYPVWGPGQTTPRRFFGERHWQEPLGWNRRAERQGHRHSVFCGSMCDVYEENAALDSERLKLWDLIEKTPWLNWLLLTKRPENILAFSPWSDRWPDNVWVGTSVELQQRAEERIPRLLEVPAVVRFLSCEPLLGPLDLTPWLAQLQWVISGGESGERARPMDLAWPCAIRDQCLAANVPYFFKQVGGRYHNSGGRLLDGRTWNEMPPEFPDSKAFFFHLWQDAMSPSSFS
jgi:protein gp37